MFKLQQGTLPTGSVFKDKRVVISVDGGRTRLRINKKGRPSPKTHRHGYVGEWAEPPLAMRVCRGEYPPCNTRGCRGTAARLAVEPKLLTVYAVDDQGKKIKTSEFPITNDGTYDDYQGFLQILEMYLVSLGIERAKQVLLIADGAEWIWKHVPPLLERLGCSHETYQILDFYHVTEHLQDER